MKIDDSSSALILNSDGSVEISLTQTDDDFETPNNILISLLSILIASDDKEFWSLISKKEDEIFQAMKDE